MKNTQEQDAPQPQRDARGRWLPGQSGGPGRRPGGEDRIGWVLAAIQKKVGVDGPEGVVKWLSTLPDPLLATLFGKLLPRDVNLSAQMQTSIMAQGNLARLAALIAGAGAPAAG